MGKAYTKGAKRRLKKAMPELAEVPRKQPNGRTRRQASEGDPRKSALDARCDLYGIARNAKNRRTVNAAYAGTGAGRCIAHGRGHDDAMRLWDVWMRYCRARRTWEARYLGRTETPANSAIAVSGDTMQTDQSASVDLRDQDQRDRDAVAAWMRWQGHLMKLDRAHMAAINAARTDPDDALWSDATPTIRGHLFADAIVALALVAEAGVFR